MSEPADLLYSKEHEWVKLEQGMATIGITDHAQSALGDIVYVELPKVGAHCKQFSTIGVVESVKAVSDLYTPIGGEVVAVNEALEGDAALVNREPYGAGWMLKIKLADQGEVANLLSPSDYEKIASEESH